MPSPTSALLLPLSRGLVFLPGVAHRLAIPASRLDIPALVSAVYNSAAAQQPGSPTDAVSKPMAGRIASVPVICVPHNSSLMGPDGQLLVQDGSHSPFSAEMDSPKPVSSESSFPEPPSDVQLADVDPADFFSYATVARIVGFEGNAGDLGLVLEGVGRVKMGQITQQTPFFEGAVEPVVEEIALQDPQLRELFILLKSRAAELVTLHVSTLVSRPYAAGPVQLANIKRVGTIIKTAQLKDAGLLADIMASVIDTTCEEKLQLLSTLEIKPRVVKVIELLDRQMDEVKSFFKAASMAAVPARISISTGRQLPAIRPSMSPSREHSHHPHQFLPPPPTTPSGGGSHQWADDGQDANELDDLRKRLAAAELPAEAAKMVAKEFKRISKMSASNQEHQVVRNWLDTMAEIPWSKTTPDRLDKDTLARARAQLDLEHFGLEKVKQRLIEYLAVLRLKKSADEDIQGHIARLEKEMADIEAQQAAEANNVMVVDNSSSAPATSSRPSAVAVGALENSKAALDKLKNRRVVDKSPILLLAGPPGVGKTSLARSVATALGRKFHRISLGGVRDEAEIRGHRRTYVAAMPGILVQALRKTGVSNPVILLDEVDKLTPVNNNGDPAAALLEVLDPEQNHNFTDHYIGTPVDLSKVLFIATANDLSTIPAPLLDRLETINLAGYTTVEKRHIASRHLVPKQMVANGLAAANVVFPDDVITRIIESYTRESGVRNLEREIGAVCRRKAVEFAEAKDSDHLDTYRAHLTVPDVEAILGPARFETELAEDSNRPGIVMGLVAYSSGNAGSILFIEATEAPGDGKLQLTGQLGSVLQESVSVALSWVKGHAFELGLVQDQSVNVVQDRSVHIHCPGGAIPKDGPSSGLAQTVALISLFSDRPVPSTLAMTGEISLRGRVLPVGGIQAKLIGALRAGIKTVIVPAQNRRDVADLPQEVRDGMQIHTVGHITEALALVWPEWRQVAQGTGVFAGFEHRL